MTIFLIENGSDPNIPGGAPLLLKPYSLALSRNFNKVAEYLKSHGTEIDIFTACYTGDLQRIKYILGTSPELVNSLQAYEDVNSIVPLHYAIHGGEIETIEYLFSLKPDYKPYTSTLLSLARSMNREDIISLIQEI
jgi:ankyrin repeat protein